MTSTILLVVAVVAILAVLVLTSRPLKSMVSGIRRVREAQAAVDSEIDFVRRLPLDSAIARAERLIDLYATVEPRRAADTAREQVATVGTLDESVLRLFDRYQRIRFPSETELSLTPSVPTAEVPPGLTVIGTNPQDQCLVCVRAGAPEVYDVANGLVRDQFASIFHYIAVVEDPGDTPIAVER